MVAAIAWHQLTHKKPFIFIALKGVPCALGRCYPPVMIHVEFKAGTSDRERRVEFVVGVPTPGFDDWPGEIAGNE